MSEQKRSAVSSSLEEVFLSGEFGRAPGESPLASPAGANLRWGEVVDHPLEEVFLSDSFGRDEETIAFERSDGGPAEAVGAVPLPFRPMPPWRIRYRAAAAASSVAAVAMVVSVMAAGGGPSGLTTLAAAGRGGSAHGAGTGPQGPAGAAAISAAPRATPVDAAMVSTSSSGRASVRSGGSTSAGVLVSSPGASRSPVPSSSAPVGTGSAAAAPVVPGPPPSPPVPTPPSGSGTGFSGLATTVGNTVSSAMSSTAGQLGAAIPFAASAAGAVNGVGATVTGLGQSL